MMVIPSKKHDEFHEKVRPWIIYGLYEHKLSPDAPADVKEAWDWLKKHPIKYELD